MRANTRGDWRDGSDDGPRFTRGTRRWFALHVRAAIEAEPTATALYELQPEEVGRVTDWLLGHHMDYAKYQPTEEYRGAGWSHGAWIVDRAALKLGWRLALNTIRATGESETDTGGGLEAWLRADLAGTVNGAKGGDAAISDEQWASLAGAAEARRRTWPGQKPRRASGARKRSR
jgi:hypothetical protein